MEMRQNIKKQRTYSRKPGQNPPGRPKLDPSSKPDQLRITITKKIAREDAMILSKMRRYGITSKSHLYRYMRLVFLEGHAEQPIDPKLLSESSG